VSGDDVQFSNPHQSPVPNRADDVKSERRQELVFRAVIMAGAGDMLAAGEVSTARQIVVCSQ
jgi:hypothetical protein